VEVEEGEIKSPSKMMCKSEHLWLVPRTEFNVCPAGVGVSLLLDAAASATTRNH